MTEIPEHLLNRSRERRAALGLGGEGGEATSAAERPEETTPAVQEGGAAAPAATTAPAGRAAAPVPPAAPPPKPDSPVVAAAKARRKIPFWAVGALALLPIWVFMYARALTEQAEAAEGALGVGAEVYNACASCHGGSGQGGVGYAFAQGEITETFPHIEDQIRFVYFGTQEYNLAGVEIYGNPEREGGPHVTGGLSVMPAWGALANGELSDAELLGVVCHERYTLGGAEEGEEFEEWCSEESEIFTGLEDGSLDLTTMEQTVDDIIPIGTVPVPGSPPGDE